MLENLTGLAPFVGRRPAIKLDWQRPPLPARLAILTGTNGSGKSFFAGLVGSFTAVQNLAIIDCSMRRRTSSGLATAFMYGDESWESTGQISIRNTLAALRTSRGRDIPHYLVLDEPDLGLAPEYAAALGGAIADFCEDMPDLLYGLVLVTHSVPLFRPLRSSLTA
jgi:predicted ATPase